MASDEPTSPKRGARVLSFRRGRAVSQAAAARQAQEQARNTVQDLAKYERGPQDGGADGDDYRHRMIVNLAAFLFVIALIIAGLWLADTMARMRKNQDCVLSGRRGCSPVDVIPRDRW